MNIKVNQIEEAKRQLQHAGYTIAELCITPDGGHLYVIDKITCFAGKTLSWTEERKHRIGSFIEAIQFINERS